MDIVNAAEDTGGPGPHDLSSDALWVTLHEDLTQGRYQCVFMGTPCETFSRARNTPPGPRPLRTPEHIYGLPKGQLKEWEHDQVRMGTYFALQSSKTAALATAKGVPWALENPEPLGNPVSLFELPEFQELARQPEVQALGLDQCTVGAISRKPTRILSWGLDFSPLAKRCDHPSIYQEWVGRDGWTEAGKVRHPPLLGKDASGAYRTKAAAAYPSAMNEVIARVIADSRVRR